MESLQPNVDSLKKEKICSLTLTQLEEEKVKHDFCIDHFKGNDRKIRHYTGIATYEMFIECYDFLVQLATEKRTWQGKRTSTDKRTTQKAGPKSKLPLEDLFLHGNGLAVTGLDCRRPCTCRLLLCKSLF